MSRRAHQRKTEPKSSVAPTSKAPDETAESDTASDAAPDFVRRGLLGAATALLVARPLVASDGGPWVGDGQGFVALWIVLAVLWMIGSLGRRRLTVRFGWLDAVMVAWAAWWSIAAILGARAGAPRPSTNMLWEGIGTLVAFLMLRQLATRPREWRALMAVMIGLAVAMSGTAMWQYFVTMPAQRAEFAVHPAEMFQKAGVEMPPAGSSEFKQFQDRLNSPEPLGTFTLTNSLAAYLAPWLLIVVGIAALGWPARQNRSGVTFNWRWSCWLSALGCGLPIAVALALTRSRSAWIAAAVGVGVLGWLIRSQARFASPTADRTAAGSTGNQPRRRRSLALVIGTAVIVVAGIGVAVIRPQVLEPAIRSFRFRLEYWQSTLKMIGDHPVFGCGPGNFKDYYTRYKLPQASEEVSDPHNFLLEIAATAGLPALLLLLTVLGGFAGRTFRRPLAATAATVASTDDGTLWILVGAMVGFWLALAWNLVMGLGAWIDRALVGILLAGVAIALEFAWIRRGALPPALAAIGATVLLVALLSVGGITFAGVSGTLWLLVAIGLNSTEWPDVARRTVPPAVGWLLMVVLGLIAFCQHQTGYEPVLACQTAMEAARERIARQPPASPEAQWILAAEADPWAVEPRRLLAQTRLDQWRDSGPPPHRDSAKLHEFELLTESALALDPLSCSLWSEAGVNWREVYEAARLPSYGRSAVNVCRRATDLYPTSPTLQIELAKTLATTGIVPAAQAAAREGLRLDKLTPHEDKKLSAEQRRLAERIISGDNSVIPQPTPSQPTTSQPGSSAPAKPADKAGPPPSPP